MSKPKSSNIPSGMNSNHPLHPILNKICRKRIIGVSAPKGGKIQEFFGMGFPKIFLVKGKKPQGGRTAPPLWIRGLTHTKHTFCIPLTICCPY